MTANHLRPLPPLHADEVVSLHKGRLKDGTELLIRTYGDGAVTGAVKDFGRWGIEFPLTPEVIL